MDEPFVVVFLRRVVVQIDAARQWWNAERAEAVGRLDEELGDAVARLQRMPSIGTPLLGRRGVRRLVLPTTRYVLYYRVRPQARRCEVIDLVHASRVL